MGRLLKGGSLVPNPQLHRYGFHSDCSTAIPERGTACTHRAHPHQRVADAQRHFRMGSRFQVVSNEHQIRPAQPCPWHCPWLHLPQTGQSHWAQRNWSQEGAQCCTSLQPAVRASIPELELQSWHSCCKTGGNPHPDTAVMF